MPANSERPKTIAVDLDGTILSDVGLPGYGKPIAGVIEQLMMLRMSGWNIVIWTCRGDTQKVKDILTAKGIPFDYVNENPHYPSESPKIHADVYLDDKAIGFRGEVKNLAQNVLEFKLWHKIEEAVYSCAECGVMRTKSEGGTVFTVCDDCWDKDSEKAKEKEIETI